MNFGSISVPKSEILSRDFSLLSGVFTHSVAEAPQPKLLFLVLQTAW